MSAKMSNSKGGLDGRQFTVDIVNGPALQLETPDNLVFQNETADVPICHVYGFEAAPYKAYEENGVCYFSFTSISDDQGSLVFNGQVIEENIRGQYTWYRTDGTELTYQFQGQEIK